MTTFAEEPSLVQAPGDIQTPLPKQHQHDHHHQHEHRRPSHVHQHHHSRFLPDSHLSSSGRTPTSADDNHLNSITNHIDLRSPKEDGRFIEKRVVVLETKTVVEFVDATGAVTSVTTISSPPVTQSAADGVGAGVTSGSSLDSASAASAAVTALTTPTPSTAPSTGPDPSTASLSVAVSVSAEIGLSLDLTSTLLTTGTLSSQGYLNISSVVSSSLSTTTLPSSFFSSSNSNSTVSWASFYSNTSTSITSLSSSYTTESGRTRFRASTKTSSSSTSSTAVAFGPTSGSGAGSAGVDGDGSGSGASATPASASNGESSGSGLTQPAKNAIIAVSGLAGVAIFSFLLLLFLKWKKRQGGGAIRLLGDGGGSGGGTTGSGPVAQLRSLPLLLPGILASRVDAGGEAPTQERGFQRISGRKLRQSAIESGGDGYSDPPDPRHANNNPSEMRGAATAAAARDSVISDGDALSVYNRASCAFLNGPSRFQLNSPLRPASGELFVRDSPARTPLQELSPFSDPVPESPPGPPPMTPLPTIPATKNFPAASPGCSSHMSRRTDAMDWAAVAAGSSPQAGPSAPRTLTPRFREGM